MASQQGLLWWLCRQEDLGQSQAVSGWVWGGVGTTVDLIVATSISLVYTDLYTYPLQGQPSESWACVD